MEGKRNSRLKTQVPTSGRIINKDINPDTEIKARIENARTYFRKLKSFSCNCELKQRFQRINANSDTYCYTDTKPGLSNNKT